MIKKMASLAMAMAFVAGSAVASYALDCNGEVKAIQGKKVTVVCENGTETTAEAGAAKITVGEKITVKDGKVTAKVAAEKAAAGKAATGKAKKQIEGC